MLGYNFDHVNKRGPRDPCHKIFSMVNKIRWKFRFLLSTFKNLIDYTVLSLYVQNLYQSDRQKLIYSKANRVPSNLNHDGFTVSEMYPKTLSELTFMVKHFPAKFDKQITMDWSSCVHGDPIPVMTSWHGPDFSHYLHFVSNILCGESTG